MLYVYLTIILKKFILNNMDGILAGIIIGCAAWVKMLAPGEIIGALLFSFGLLTICYLNISLFTGKAGAVEVKNKNAMIDLLKLLGENLFGVLLFAIVAVMSDYWNITEASEYVVYTRLTARYISVFFSAIGCGLLVDISVHIFKTKNTPVAIIFCVPAFILAGMPHCIADSFYYIGGIKLLSFKTIILFFITVIGNFIGCNIRRIFQAPTTEIK